MEKIPTAEELFDKKHPQDGILPKWTENLMIEFAQIHVQAALKAASQLEETNGTEGYKIYPDSILNSYSLENIK